MASTSSVSSAPLPGFHKVILSTADKAIGSTNQHAVFHNVVLPTLFKRQVGVVVQSFCVEDNEEVKGKLNDVTYNVRCPQLMSPYSYNSRNGSMSDYLLTHSGYVYQHMPSANDAGFHAVLDPTAMNNKTIEIIIDSDTNITLSTLFENPWSLTLGFYEVPGKRDRLDGR